MPPRGVADINFVRRWAGGDTGSNLVHLETFERSLDVKRRISPADLEAMARIKFADHPVFVIAMVKAMLAAPPKYASSAGVSTLFQAADFAAVNPHGKKRAMAELAANLMKPCRGFATAYSHAAPSIIEKAASTLEIRLVMHMRALSRTAIWGRRGTTTTTTTTTTTPTPTATGVTMRGAQLATSHTRRR